MVSHDSFIVLIWRKQQGSSSSHYAYICLEVRTKITSDLIHSSLPWGRNLNLGPPESEAWLHPFDSDIRTVGNTTLNNPRSWPVFHPVLLSKMQPPSPRSEWFHYVKLRQVTSLFALECNTNAFLSANIKFANKIKCDNMASVVTYAISLNAVICWNTFNSLKH
jgi:hypothetical protein